MMTNTKPQRNRKSLKRIFSTKHTEQMVSFLINVIMFKSHCFAKLKYCQPKGLLFNLGDWFFLVTCHDDQNRHFGELIACSLFFFFFFHLILFHECARHRDDHCFSFTDCFFVFLFSAEIIMLDGLTCVYRSNVDLFFYVMGSSNENEVNVLSGFQMVYLFTVCGRKLVNFHGYTLY